MNRDLLLREDIDNYAKLLKVETITNLNHLDKYQDMLLSVRIKIRELTNVKRFEVPSIILAFMAIFLTLSNSLNEIKLALYGENEDAYISNLIYLFFIIVILALIYGVLGYRVFTIKKDNKKLRDLYILEEYLERYIGK